MTKLITVVLCLLAFAAFSLTGCSTGTAPNPLENPAVQTAITALEQEAMQLLNDYIHSHFGAAKNSKSATAAVEAQLQARHPDVSRAKIAAVVHAAASK